MTPLVQNHMTMTTFKQINARLRGSNKSSHFFAIAILGALVFISSFTAIAQTAALGSKTKVETTAPVKAEPLSGAELWTLNCARCHAVRSPGEFTAAQWPMILMEMRVRANLPAAQARELQKFLQAGAGK